MKKFYTIIFQNITSKEINYQIFDNPNDFNAFKLNNTFQQIARQGFKTIDDCNQFISEHTQIIDKKQLISESQKNEWINEINKSINEKPMTDNYINSLKYQIIKIDSILDITLNNLEITTPINIYTDGSYNCKSKTHAYGIAIIINNTTILLSGKFESNITTIGSTSSEIQGLMTALLFCATHKIKTPIKVYCDCDNLKNIFDSTNTVSLDWQFYIHFYNHIIKYIDFKKEYITIVKSHSEIIFNDLVDSLAKKALGIN